MADGRGDSGDHARPAPPQKYSALVAALTSARNSDGGWPYRKGTSWTEPTVLALLALGPDSPSSARGLNWLRNRQRSDGGWPPQPAVEQATWVTSLVALLPPESIGKERADRALSGVLS